MDEDQNKNSSTKVAPESKKKKKVIVVDLLDDDDDDDDGEEKKEEDDDDVRDYELALRLQEKEYLVERKKNVDVSNNNLVDLLSVDDVDLSDDDDEDKKKRSRSSEAQQRSGARGGSSSSSTEEDGDDGGCGGGESDDNNDRKYSATSASFSPDTCVTGSNVDEDDSDDVIFISSSSASSNFYTTTTGPGITTHAKPPPPSSLFATAAAAAGGGGGCPTAAAVAGYAAGSSSASASAATADARGSSTTGQSSSTETFRRSNSSSTNNNNNNTRRRRDHGHDHDHDFMLARQLQEQEETFHQQQKKLRVEHETNLMMSTTTGKALKFVETVLQTTMMAQVETSTSTVPPPAPAAAPAAVPSAYAASASASAAFAVSTTTPTATSPNSSSGSASSSSSSAAAAALNLEPVSKDDMVYMTERLLEFQSSLLSKASSSSSSSSSDTDMNELLHVDLGFHYTKTDALSTIRTNGLLSRQERTATSTGKQTGAEAYGNGIYTANNPYSFAHFGPVGLVVARLKGRTSPRDNTYKLQRHSRGGGVVSQQQQQQQPQPTTISNLQGMTTNTASAATRATETLRDNSYNTIVGNKSYRPGKGKHQNHHQHEQMIELHDEVVLKTSAQVIPLLKFDTAAVSPHNIYGPTNLSQPTSQFQQTQNTNQLWDAMDKLKSIIDEYFNMPNLISGSNMSNLKSPPSLSVFQRMSPDEYHQRAGHIAATAAAAGGGGRFPVGLTPIRNKQQRLLLLRHAGKCQCTSTCPVTPHCKQMKKLWAHLADCKVQQCSFDHCTSSRYVLCHYKNCKNSSCRVCAPVRQAIQKSNAAAASAATSTTNHTASTVASQPTIAAAGAAATAAQTKTNGNVNAVAVPPPAVTWQREGDMTTRREVMKQLMDIMKSIRGLLSLIGPFNNPLGSFCQKVEGELYLWAKSRDEYNDHTTLMKRAVRTLDRLYKIRQPSSINRQLVPSTHRYKSPTSFQTQSLNYLKVVTDPEELKKASIDQCAICLDVLVPSQAHQQQHSLQLKQHDLVKLPCGHFFHFGCIQESIQKHGPCCPMACSKTVGSSQGKCPSGTMRVNYNLHLKCSGYETTSGGTITITYSIESGVQRQYHPSPGTRHPGTTRVCYLPNNIEGSLLLMRLEYAFMHGLTFTVGTSLTTHLPNQITWGSIHHKTSTSGGTASHGYPDLSYMDNCNDELDRLGVPPITELLDTSNAAGSAGAAVGAAPSLSVS